MKTEGDLPPTSPLYPTNPEAMERKVSGAEAALGTGSLISMREGKAEAEELSVQRQTGREHMISQRLRFEPQG